MKKNLDIDAMIQVYNSGGMGVFRCKQLIDLLLDRDQIRAQAESGTIVDVKKLMADYESMDEFDPGHPIFQMAQENDLLRAQVEALQSVEISGGDDIKEKLNDVFKLLRSSQSGIRRLRISGKDFGLPDEIRQLAISHENDEFFTAMGAVKEATKLLQASPNKADVPTWQPIENAPKDGKSLLIKFKNEGGNERVVIGFWVARFSMEDTSDEYEFGEFNEETEMYYWPQGWYESYECHNEYSAGIVTESSIAGWQPLPPLKDE